MNQYRVIVRTEEVFASYVIEADGWTIRADRLKLYKEEQTVAEFCHWVGIIKES